MVDTAETAAAEETKTSVTGDAASTSQEKETKDENSGEGSSVKTEAKTEEQSAAEKAASDSKGADGDENQDGDDDGIEWKQTRSASNQTTGESPKGSGEDNVEDVEALKKVIAEKDAEILELKAKVESYQGLDAAFADPLIKAWTSHRERHGSESSVSKFLEEVGKIKFVDNRSDEEKVKAYYEAESRKLGLDGELLAKAVEEDLDRYSTLGLREKRAVVVEAEKMVATTEVTSIEALEKKYNEELAKTRSAQIEWSQRQAKLFQDCLQQYVKKGSFEGRPVDSKWAERNYDAFTNSFVGVDPRYMILADPDEKGVQDLFMPEMVSIIDSIEFRKERTDFFKKAIKEGRAKNLGERAEAKEQAAIKSELQGKETPEEIRERKLAEANAADGRIPKSKT